jgi:Integrase core domain
VLDDHRVLASVGSVGDACANALAERFVDGFETELIADRVWRSRSQLELAVVEYISWFNHDRLHQALGDIPPIEFEHTHRPNPHTTPDGLVSDLRCRTGWLTTSRPTNHGLRRTRSGSTTGRGQLSTGEGGSVFHRRRHSTRGGDRDALPAAVVGFGEACFTSPASTPSRLLAAAT